MKKFLSLLGNILLLAAMVASIVAIVLYVTDHPSGHGLYARNKPVYTYDQVQFEGSKPLDFDASVTVYDSLVVYRIGDLNKTLLYKTEEYSTYSDGKTSIRLTTDTSYVTYRIDGVVAQSYKLWKYGKR